MVTRIVQSGESPQEVRILSDKVLVASNIHEVTVEETVMYEYTQIEYSKDEYIGYIQNRLAHNTANLDYLAMMNDIDLDEEE